MAVPSEAFAQFRWGAQAGVNVNNLKFKQELVSVDKSTGFSVSVISEMMFPGIGFGLDIGLHYEMVKPRCIWANARCGATRAMATNSSVCIML